jgi:hypothetical protein
MREVQLAAQRVVQENARLRELLRFMDVDESVIEPWLRGDDSPCSSTDVRACSRSGSKPTCPGSVGRLTELIYRRPRLIVAENGQRLNTDLLTDGGPVVRSYTFLFRYHSGNDSDYTA